MHYICIDVLCVYVLYHVHYICIDVLCVYVFVCELNCQSVSGLQCRTVVCIESLQCLTSLIILTISD